MELNPPQREAVQHSTGPLLVFAGAGSGKTRVITYRIANLLAEHGVPPYRILAVTFTNKAAGEMKERLTQLTGADLTLDLWVGTFHSVCARLLRRYAEEVGLSRSFSIYDDSDQKAVMTRALRQLGLDERVYPPKAVLGRVHRQKQVGLTPSEVELSHGFDEDTLHAYERYEALLRAANAVDFDDLILHVMRLAEDPDSRAGRELRQRFDHVLVDEFQDTNGVQYRLVRALAARTNNLCVVGDDDQSIYSWRGADVLNIRGFSRDFPDAHVVKLEQNYRSSANIVAAAQGVIARAAGRTDKVLWTAHDAGARVRVVATSDERAEANFVVGRVRAELASGTPAQEIGILYRINAQSRVLEEAFREANVAYQVIGGMKFFERAEIKNALSYLRLIENPRSDADLLRVINVPARGIGTKTVERLVATAERRGSSLFDALEPMLTSSELQAGAKKKLSAFAELVNALRQDHEHERPSALAELLLQKSGYLKELERLDTAEADARLENLREFVGSIAEYEATEEHQGREPSLSGYLERISLVADIDQAQAGAAVLLMTVHSAKGLEFDHVTVTGLEEQMFPYRGFEGHDADELEEERRLLYVALTRAKKQLILTYASTRMIFGQSRYASPSRFLSDLPEAAVQREGAPTAARPSWSGPRFSGEPVRSPVASGSVKALESSPAAPRRAAPAAPNDDEGGRVIDYDAFDDVPRLPRNLRIGARVVHERFGRGIIARIEEGAEQRVVARFPGFGERKVLASYLRFE